MSKTHIETEMFPFRQNCHHSVHRKLTTSSVTSDENLIKTTFPINKQLSKDLFYWIILTTIMTRISDYTHSFIWVVITHPCLIWTAVQINRRLSYRREIQHPTFSHECTYPWPSQIAKFMGTTWGPPGPCRPQMSPMLAPWTLLSGYPRCWFR